MTTITATTGTDREPVHVYAALLLNRHDLIAHGKGDTEEADALRDRMDEPWYALSEESRQRVGGLSEDLYALAERGPKQVEMTAAEREHWSAEAKAAQDAYQKGDFDTVLRFLRQPSPRGLPPELVLRFRAKCWEGLGHSEIAARFVQAAGSIDLTNCTIPDLR